MLSKNGVCYNLPETPFIYEWRGLRYHFSSASHRDKYVDNVRKKEMWINDSLSRRFKCTVDLPLLADIQLYTQVESRGFYVVSNDGAEYKSAVQMYVTNDLLGVGVINAVAL